MLDCFSLLYKHINKLYCHFSNSFCSSLTVLFYHFFFYRGKKRLDNHTPVSTSPFFVGPIQSSYRSSVHVHFFSEVS
ncbi:wsv065 [White spot syndrome virus]|uniref:Wsv065 n=4 Tax=White spot syndrome virus TaxID=342409 RepID=Q8VBA9_WSSVS|nr:wsv065 [Shrimp white spot syndrome virus]AFX59442.1 wsv065 [White spot syndrome virus]AAL33069.1 wsv065 [Shrimp white spot syndrome virus]AAL88990.1 WSSV122 [Shrimp white spot syndrome virus]AWQ60254.1 wsv065 [Shrimp white spot syndrome virus]AWQ60672.1 wsv065 [Shrimp white spot syndrome virus]